MRDQHQPMSRGLCPLTFYGKRALQLHCRNVHRTDKQFECELCNKKYSRKDNMLQHQKTCTEKSTSSGAGMKRSFTILNPDITFAKTARSDLQFNIDTIDEAFNGAAETYCITYKDTLNIMDLR